MALLLIENYLYILAFSQSINTSQLQSMSITKASNNSSCSSGVGCDTYSGGNSSSTGNVLLEFTKIIIFGLQSYLMC